MNMIDEDDGAFRQGPVQNRLGLGDIEGQGFFHQYRQALLDGGQGHLRMQRRGGGDNDAVQVINFYHLPPILMDFASRTDNPRAFGVAASEAGERYAVNPVDGPDKITAPRAGTDEAETKGFVVSAHVLPV